ncbi:MAG: hypothetical protein ACYDAB_00760 [bacterium]
MPFNRTIAIAAVLVGVAVVAGIAKPAFADPRDVSVGGVWITRITHDWAGVSAADRATEITRRITQVLSVPQLRQGAVVAVRQDGANALITVGDILVFMVTPADAEGEGSPMHVAKYWAALLGQGLTRALPGSAFYF